MTLSEYREFVKTHLKYIREKVEANNSHLQKVNGRLNKAEKDIAWIKGIGSTITFLVTVVVSLIYFIQG
tara:strand:- start:4758 stop:4964 length:207 start_codon:yes stop_codon:yes gene_type:complete